MVKWIVPVLALFTTGCAQSPFAGDWHPDPLPSGVSQATLHFSADGTYAGQSLKTHGDAKSFAGHWMTASASEAKLMPTDPSKGTATFTLLGKDKAVFASPGESVTFVRQQAAR